MDNECIASWLKSIKEKYIHGGDEALDSTRKLAIDLAIERLNKQQAENVDAFIQWCADGHMMGAATLNGIKYWVEKYKEFVSKGR